MPYHDAVLNLGAGLVGVLANYSDNQLRYLEPVMLDHLTSHL
jgi:hypothetical protein